jgi:hypothetical protein
VFVQFQSGGKEKSTTGDTIDQIFLVVQLLLVSMHFWEQSLASNLKHPASILSFMWLFASNAMEGEILFMWHRSNVYRLKLW